MTSFLAIAGGVGLFLVGMIVLSDGLKAMAGQTLRRALGRYARTPASGAATGAVTTALVQSSSATTVTVVGFVGAGILTFHQALGVIFGANIGTTFTGWLVALLGFKIKLGMLALPLVFAGVLLRIYGRGVWRNIGWALVGFSLLFIGISTMQEGAAGFEGQLLPDVFPADTMLGRLQLLGLGILVTVVTQSSSAGVATAMVALAGGMINFTQAAAMVIGMDVGTTLTAALATVGGSTSMRQTGYAHVIYNLLTGIAAFLMLVPVEGLLQSMGLTDPATGDAQVGLAIFHSFFNIAGMLIVLPFTHQFARLVQRLVPSDQPELTSALDKKLLVEPPSAVDAACYTVCRIRNAVFKQLEPMLKHRSLGRVNGELELALEVTDNYIKHISIAPEAADHPRLVEAGHALDHLRRLNHRLAQRHLMPAIGRDQQLKRLARLLRQTLKQTQAGLLAGREEDLPDLEKFAALMTRQEKAYRKHTVSISVGQQTLDEGMLERLDSARWLSHVSHHLWRISKHTRGIEAINGR